jgi:lipopolysaccharide export system protein LptA
MKSPNLKSLGAALAAALALHLPPACAERADRDKPMHLEADQVNMDDAKQISTFEGHVLLTQGTMSIRADKLVVVQSDDGYAHGVASGHPADFRQKREGFDEYIEGYGERIEYDTRSETVDLYGQAHMKRDGDEVRGDHITYSAKTEIFQVHGAADAQSDTSDKGRVRVILQPKGHAGAARDEPLTIRPADTLSPPPK